MKNSDSVSGGGQFKEAEEEALFRGKSILPSLEQNNTTNNKHTTTKNKQQTNKNKNV